MEQDHADDATAATAATAHAGGAVAAGVLDGAEYSEPGVGTVQGSVLSPLLGNVYLHHVLDTSTS